MSRPLREAQIASIHEAIGLFVVEFSQVIHRLELGISIAAPYDLHFAVQEPMAGMTAGDLVEYFFRFCGKKAHFENEDRSLERALRRELAALIEARNDILHGAWMVGWGNAETTDWSEPRVFRRGKGRAKEVDGRAPALEALAADARRLQGVVQQWAATSKGSPWPNDPTLPWRPCHQIWIEKGDKKLYSTNRGGPGQRPREAFLEEIWESQERMRNQP